MTVPLRSMTGFGAATRPWAQAPGGPASVAVEVRSVNARWLEIKLRQPFGAAVEHALRERLRAVVGRGRVEAFVHLRPHLDAGVDELAVVGVDSARLDAAVRAVARAGRRAEQAGLALAPCTAVDLLRLAAAPPAGDAGLAAPGFLGEVFDEALAALAVMRAREGDAVEAALRTELSGLSARLAALREAVREHAPAALERVRERVAELCGRSGTPVPEPERVAQEVALLAARADVTEELARIESHLSQTAGVLAEKAAPGQGRTLDFLAQELTREVGTVGSKATVATAILLEIKAGVSRFREQVQNVE
jgi:uncharacterized protein (TIGR00255 family)